MSPDSSLEWLQSWFARRANGDWEHRFGIKIETLDNPGWRVTIDLSGTALASKSFTDVRVDNSENNWITCRVAERKFEAFCDPGRLAEALEVFRSWASEKS